MPFWSFYEYVHVIGILLENILFILAFLTVFWQFMFVKTGKQLLSLYHFNGFENNKFM